MKIISQLMHLSVKARLTCALVVLVGLSVGTRSALAQQNPGESFEAREARQDWLQANLTLDNSGYAATRAQIDKLIRQGQKPAVLEQKYRMQGKEIYDARKIFRWAYAAYRVQKLSPQQNFLFKVNTALDRNLRPGAYDWVRLRFLVASLQTFLKPTAQLIEVGRRLLKQRYNDEEVMFHFLGSLKYSESLEERKQAVALARAEARKRPRDVYWQWTVANCVSSVADYRARTTYRQNEEVIAEYKKTLQMLPAGHPYRRRIVETLVRLDLNFDDNGNAVKWNLKMLREALKNTTLR